MKSVELRNLRTFKTTGAIEFPPLTILVGRNSSGKSSLLRFFPLLRQSVETRTSGPLLWYGNYVDFGSFDEACRRGEKTISARFTFKQKQQTPRSYRSLWQTDLNFDATSYGAAIEISSNNLSDYVSRVTVEIDDINACVSIKENGEVESVSVDNLAMEAATAHVIPSTFVPSIAYSPTSARSKSPIYQATAPGTSDYLPSLRSLRYYDRRYQSKVFSKLVEVVQEIAGGQTSTATVVRIISKLSRLRKSSFPAECIEKHDGMIWQRHVSDPAWSEKLEQARRLLIVLRLPIFLYEVDAAISRFANSVEYLGPFRALAQRFSRQQQLAVDRVDHRGENIIALLASLPVDDQARFRKWSEKNFGLGISVTSSGGHSWLTVREPGTNVEEKLSDVGFGYSQIAPLAVQLWLATNNGRAPSNVGEETRLFLIEQPELHLHPAHQARLARAFATYVRATRNRLHAHRIVLETHSESIVNTVGGEIRAGRISDSDVQILLVEPGDDGSSRVHRATFDSDGLLDNWPLGFFSPDIDR